MKSTPTSKSLQTYLPWAAVAVLAFLLFRGRDADTPAPTPPGPTPAKSVLELTADVLPATAAGYRVAFSAAAERVAAGEIVDDRGLVDYLSAETLAARQAAQADWDAAIEATLPDGPFGEEADAVAKLLAGIAEAW